MSCFVCLSKVTLRNDKTTHTSGGGVTVVIQHNVHSFKSSMQTHGSMCVITELSGAAKTTSTI